jgi:hypothetical protein
MCRSDIAGSPSRRKWAAVPGRVRSNSRALRGNHESERRIYGAERFTPPERLALSLQHGFAFTWEGILVREAGRETNLRRAAKTARERRAKFGSKFATRRIRTSRGNPPN